MRLIRWVTGSIPNIHPGPIPGGTFWALDGAHDLPIYGESVAYADPGYLMRHGSLWMQDVLHPGSWEPVTDLTQLAGFHTRYVGHYEGMDIWVEPYQPEFYYVPCTFRGARAIRRAHNHLHYVSF